MSGQSPRKSPAYVIIADEVRSWIENGEYAPGGRLPNERELVERFGVARMTVRHALDILQMEGCIDRKRGRTGGTFVRAVPPTVELTQVDGIFPQLEAMGREVNTIVTSQQTMQATARISRALDLEPEAPVYNVVRVRTVDGTPLMVQNSFYPVELVEGMDEYKLDGNIHKLLADKWDMAPTRKAETIIPSIASEWEQQQLGISRNLPVLNINRVSETKDGIFVEYSEDVLRSDIVRIKVITDVN